MGKVLIALCTVFLLAFPARGEQAVTWESLAVWNDLPPLYDPAPWPSDLAGKRVILRWNGKHNGDLLLDYLHSLLSRAFPDTEFIKAYETDPALSGISKDLPESEATARALLELRPDLVIAATGDCRACSAWLAIDQIQLEPSSQIVGTQAVLNIITGERYKMVPKESKAMLRGEYGKLPGTVNEKVRAKVDEAFPAILGALRSGKAADSAKTFPAETAPPAEAEAPSAAPGKQIPADLQ